LKARVNNKTTENVRHNNKAKTSEVLRLADILYFLYVYREFILVQVMYQISYHRYGMIDFVYYYVNLHFTSTTLSIKESDN